MLCEESAAFAHSGDDTGCIPSLQMSIKLKDDFPFQKSYASIPKQLYKKVKEYIQDLIVKGWIVKSHSPYAAPIVCVRKKDGSLRLCIDYRLHPCKGVVGIIKNQDIICIFIEAKWWLNKVDNIVVRKCDFAKISCVAFHMYKPPLSCSGK